MTGQYYAKPSGAKVLGLSPQRSEMSQTGQ